MIRLIFVGLTFLLSYPAVAEIEIDEDSKKPRKEFKKSKMNISKGSKIILNQYLKKNDAKGDSLYSVEFTCRHSKDKNEDKCKFSNIDYQKSGDE